MLEGPVLIIILLGAIVFIILTTSVLKLHPFFSLIIATFGVGLLVKMPLQKIISSVNNGFGGLMGYIGLVIIFGTIIGTILENSGATIKIADVVLSSIGKKRPTLAMSLIGSIVSIPVFCDSGFVILSSLNKAVAKRAKVSLATMTVALSSGLYATHTLVPPTPGPIAAAGNIGASDYLGTVIGIGLITAIPAILVGYWWALRIKSITIADEDNDSNFNSVLTEIDPLPSAFRSFGPIVLPVILIAGASIVKFLELSGNVADSVLFIGNPLVALLLGVFMSFMLLPKFDEEHLNKWIAKGIMRAGPILLITGAGGAFGSVLKATPLTELIKSIVNNSNVSGSSFLIIAFFIAAALKSSQGSSTAALVITSSVLAPLLPALNISTPAALALVVMAIGAGAMTVSHVNDSYFWVVTQFSGLKLNDAYRSFTIVTLLQGGMVLLTTLILFKIMI
ncbi:MAG: GntP family permease [bacterium]